MDIKSIAQLFDSKLETVHTRLDGFDKTLKDILCQQRMFNERVEKMEGETELMRILSKYPKIFMLVVLGVLVVVSYGVDKIFSL